MVKALVIAPEPFFSPRGTPLSIYYRALVMTELGVSIDLLTYGQGNDVAIAGVRIIRIPPFRWLGEVRVGPSFLKAFLDIFLFLFAVGLLLRHRYDFVHAHEEAVFLARFLKPIFGFKVVYDMHSSLPQQLRNFRFTRSNVLVGLFRTLEDSALRASDIVITICPDLARYALEKMEDEKKHFLIENSIFEDVKLADSAATEGESRGSAPADERSADLSVDRQIVVYAGTLEPYQGIDLLMRAFQLLQQELPELFLLLIGGNRSQVQRYSELAHELGIHDKCLLTGWVPQATARRYCRLASVQVSPRTHGNNTPLKIYEQLASGIPLVATDIWAHTQVLDEEVCFLVEATPGALARGLRAALVDQSARRARVEEARRLYESRYSRSAYVAKVEALLRALRSAAPAPARRSGIA